MKTDKKGFLLAEETLKIILAVIAIGFLAYFLFSLYSVGKDSQNLEYAESSLNLLVDGISKPRPEVEIPNPREWMISSWPNTYLTGFRPFGINTPFTGTKEGIPQSCLNLGWSSCICICKKATPDKCDSKGICLDNPQGFSFEDSIKIKNPPITLLIDYQNKIISKK